MVDVYKLSKKDFVRKINSMKSNKKVLRNFLVNFKHKLPLNDNYLLLIEKNINSNSLCDFLNMGDRLRFELDEVDKIFKLYDNIDEDLLFGCVWNTLNQKDLLEFYQVVINNMDYKLNKTVILDAQYERDDAFLYLILIEPGEENSSLYSEVLTSYVNNIDNLILKGDEYLIKKFNEKLKIFMI